MASQNGLLNEEDPTIILVIICSYVLKKENWKNSIQYQSYECLKNLSDLSIVCKNFIVTAIATPTIYTFMITDGRAVEKLIFNKYMILYLFKKLSS